MAETQQRSPRASRWLALAALFAAATLAVSAAPASATLATTFATFGEGAGLVDEPVGVAVDQSDGVVYVADSENRRIDEFDENGIFIRAFGEGVRTGAEELQVCSTATTCQAGLANNKLAGQAGSIRPSGLVVDPATHNLFASDFGRYRVEEFTPAGGFVLAFGHEVDKTTHGDVCTAASGDTCGPGVTGTGPGAFGHAASFPYMPLARDASGHIWVGDINRLEEFSATGAFLSEVTLAGADEVAALAVDSAGKFYTFSGAESVKNEGAAPGVHKYDPGGNPLNFTSLGSNTLSESGQPLALTLDIAGHLIVGDAIAHLEFHESYRFLEFDTETGLELEAFGTDEVLGVPGPGATSLEGGGDQGGTIAFGDHGTPRLYTANGRHGPDALNPASGADQFFNLPPAGPLLRTGSPFAAPIGGTTATLKGFLDPEGAETKYHFEYVDQHSFETEGGFASPHTKSTPTATLSASFSEPEVSAAITGLTGETNYRIRLVAENAGGKGNTLESAGFTTLAPVLFDSIYAVEVASTSATLSAEINPVGALSAYRFEYLTEAEYQHNVGAGLDPFAGAAAAPAPDGFLGSGEADVAVSQHLQKLRPGTVYRYRAAAHNVGGERFSAVQTITTQLAGLFSLPDGRAWELVSPAEKHGAPFAGIGDSGIIQAAAAGGGIAYLANTPTESESQGFFSKVQVLSERGPEGWVSHDISLPHEAASGFTVGTGEEYRFFSEDLSSGLVQPWGALNPSLSPEASEQTPFVRTDFLGGEPSDPCLPATSSCYRPVLTGCPAAPAECKPLVEEHADVPRGTVFGVNSSTLAPCSLGPCGPGFRGATPDLSHVVIESPHVGLTAAEGDRGGLYEWADGALSLVSVLPSGEPASTRSSTPTLGFDNKLQTRLRHAISDDGSRVVYSFAGHVYDRDPAAGATLQLDRVQGGTGEKPGGSVARFQSASADGRIVYFTDEQKLTAGSAASEGRPDLYECEIVEAEGEPTCKLSDLTPGGNVQGMALGTSDDGSYVYFVASGELAPGATSGTCSNSASEERGFQHGAMCNLYVRHAGTTKLVAVLSGEDASDWAEEPNRLTARVSPNGRWLAFMSQRSLTGYDNHDARSGAPDEEVFLYDAEANGGEGKLVCASCDPSGARPSGVEYGRPPTLSGGDRVWRTKTWLAANIPGWTSYETGKALYQARYLSDSGRLFFNSHDALLPQDTNGAEDVYEWEPPGVGDCTASSATLVPSTGGCLGLISSGTSPVESAFLDASESGGDVFFLSASKLAAEDVDDAYDVYDAHLCSASSPCPPPAATVAAPCDGDACQSLVELPQDPTPGSLTFSGPGNILGATSRSGTAVKKSAAQIRAEKLAHALKACKKVKNTRKRASCKRQARKRYGPASKAAKRRAR
jgi:NHL repeat/WD40-like Beta Propeller Repeat